MAEQQMVLAGVSTAVLQGGEGPEVVLLHGPGGSAVHWLRVLPDLTATNRVIAPDLPGQGSSVILDGPPDVLEWLDELIDRTCESKPALVGYALGGAIAAHFAAQRGDRLGALVLVDALGLAPFEPAPEFGAALHAFLAEPTGASHDELWRNCARDLDGLRADMGDTWDAFKAYNLDRASSPHVRAALDDLMEIFLEPIEPQRLARIGVPTTLIWGREDTATPVAVAEQTCARYGWDLSVVENCAGDPAIEQPLAFVQALRRVLWAEVPA
jgi:pimeloyl-ACP methyl ester carboxylesterase